MNKFLKIFTSIHTGMTRTIITTLLMCTLYAGIMFAETPVSLHVSNMKIENIIQKLRKENPSYKFLFNHEEIKNAGYKSLSIDRSPMDKVMDKLLESTDLGYYIKNDVIVIRTKQPEKSAAITVKGQIFAYFYR